MKTLITGFLCVAMCGTVAGQPELSKVLLTAKTVYVGGTLPEVGDYVVKELIQWGRFTVVKSGQPSNITIMVDKGKPFEGFPLTVTDSKTQDRLWYAANKNRWGYGDNASRQLAQALVKRLRESIESQEKRSQSRKDVPKKPPLISLVVSIPLVAHSAAADAASRLRQVGPSSASVP